jgi:hypothetical protein
VFEANTKSPRLCEDLIYTYYNSFSPFYGCEVICRGRSRSIFPPKGKFPPLHKCFLGPMPPVSPQYHINPTTMINESLPHQQDTAVEMENGARVNGIHSANGITSWNDENSRPQTPHLNSLSLTEYTTNSSPPSSTPKPSLRSLVPDEFLLPTGYPDVWILNGLKNKAYNSSISVSSLPLEYMKWSTKLP